MDSDAYAALSHVFDVSGEEELNRLVLSLVRFGTKGNAAQL